MYKNNLFMLKRLNSVARYKSLSHSLSPCWIYSFLAVWFEKSPIKAYRIFISSNESLNVCLRWKIIMNWVIRSFIDTKNIEFLIWCLEIWTKNWLILYNDQTKIQHCRHKTSVADKLKGILRRLDLVDVNDAKSSSYDLLIQLR